MARLAHDLELVATAVEGTADAEAKTAHLEVRLDRIVVKGVLGKGSLTPSDEKAILEKMHADVFRAPPGAKVVVDATPQKVRVSFPNGRVVEAPLRLSSDTKGELALSLDAIGSRVVKGPMNAFRVKDRVEVLFDLAWG